MSFYSEGYRVLYIFPDHPYFCMSRLTGRLGKTQRGKGRGGTVLEHRLIIAENIGRPLRRDEIVHHINGIRDDNRLVNLVVMSRQRHYLISSIEATLNELDSLRKKLSNMDTSDLIELNYDKVDGGNKSIH